MKLIPDLRKFIELLNSENVRYLLIGGWACNRYAEPHFTGGIDFFVEVSVENQTKLRKVLTEFGFGASLPPESSPLFQKKIIILGRPPNRIDLLSEIDGVAFTEAWSDREMDQLDGITVAFISKKWLRKNKLSTGRQKDALDAENLE